MRVIFAGTPEFARIALERIQTSGHTIALVLSQPDRPAGRGLKLQASAVKQFALAHGIAVCQPRSLRLDGKYPEEATQAREAIAAAHADVMVVAAYGLLLPQWVLDDMSPSPAHPGRLGCINIHGSLLPRWRGAAPIHRAIEAGDTHTGVTIMQMDIGLDTGDMLLTESLPITEQATTATLHDAVAHLGADLVVRALDMATDRTLSAVKQSEVGVTYAHKIEKQEAAIQWEQDASAIARRVRAFNPFPGASAHIRGETIKLWHAYADAASPGAALPGTIVAIAPSSIAVAAINSIVHITELQRPGGKRLTVAEFLRGFELQVGMRFDSSSS
ncbi:methionyl-tRNA formyltransferase [Rhodoferax aquaticus]|uniref:Methionyl-tRNA formyltransferase n=1 Tax=Rhodoferax aquaticus TaxID=2527691 RepID=A0A515EK58_9BURK|nr:methionyl-tRNA formyltransferase [Rhodoferax aquaticus]QDL53055.1 methionyl-tRNA formyltransferase [Rhodoferax aquaticus]